jgi:hypothetical protein
VAGRVDELLEVAARLLEVALGQARDGRERLAQLAAVGAAPHPDAAAARRALQHHRVADPLRRAAGLRDVLQQLRARQQRQLRLGRERARRVLEAERPDVIRRRSDERDARALAARRELGVLGQEAVAGVDRLGAGAVGRLQDPIGVQVAVRRRRAADRDRLVGGGDVQRARVGLGVDRHRSDAHAPQRAQDADRDRAPVGDEDLAEHRRGQPFGHTSNRTGVGL